MEHLDYVEAIDRLLTFVGRSVLVVVSGENSEPVVIFRGRLREGRGEGEGVAVFATDEDPLLGLYLSRDDFHNATWNGEAGTLAIAMGTTRVGISAEG